MNLPPREHHNAGIASNRSALPLKTTTRITTARLRRLACGVLGAASLAFTIDTASAQNGTNATAAYNGYLSAYLVTTHVNGYTYPLPYIAQSITNRNRLFMWAQAYVITGLEDHYDRLHAASDLTLINSILTSFLAQDKTDLTWDSWNDDLEWACIALAHGYQQTGNTAFLNAAASNWNAVWNRGWSSDLGGGIWENQNKGSKCVLSNAPFIIAGCMLYRITGDSTYITKCQQSYAWMRSNCFNTSTGQVIEGISSSGAKLTSNNSYNHGIFLQAANALYKVTTTAQYFNDAQLTVNWVVNNHSVMTEDHPNNGPFGSEEFFRGLSLFAAQNNLWTTYQPWLEANCTAAWNNRRTDYNITWNKYNTATPTTDLEAMETISSVIVQAVTQISPVAGPHFIRSYASGLAVDNTMSTAQGDGVEQWGWNAGDQQLWNFTQNSDSSWTIESFYSGYVLDDPNSSTANGTQIVQWPSNGGSNQKWVVTQQSNGAYVIKNQASGKVLDNDNKTGNGSPLVQWGANGGTNQLWYLK